MSRVFVVIVLRPINRSDIYDLNTSEKSSLLFVHNGRDFTLDVVFIFLYLLIFPHLSPSFGRDWWMTLVRIRKNRI